MQFFRRKRGVGGLDDPPTPPALKRRWFHRPGFWAVGTLALASVTFNLHGAGTSESGAIRDPRALKPVPEGFMWGVATAGYQWEGGDRASNWAAWERQGKVKEPVGLAADGWRRYEEDLDLARGMGLNAFRLSLEWSRIEPRRGEIDWQAVARYHRILKAIRDRGMEPIVTLVHYTYPAWLDAVAPRGRAAWESSYAVDHYLRFVRFVGREFGKDIKYYLTFNEPTVMVEGGYLVGVWPPGKKDVGAFLRASLNVIKAHSRAYDVLHEVDPEAMVSFNNYAGAYQVALDTQDDGMPAPGDDWFLKAFANVALQASPGPNGAQRYKMDYVAVDYYKRLTIPTQVIPPSPSQWVVYPDGFVDVLDRYYKVFGLPILIAENGFATDNGKPREDGWTRESYMVHHVAAVQKALGQGIPVIGYTYWTLTDNYEWGSFNDRFGLYHVDCRGGDYTRVPTAAVDVYREIVKRGGVSPELWAQHPYISPLAAKTARRLEREAREKL